VKRQWTLDELIDEWTLLPEEETLLGNKSGATRLGFAVLFKYFQHDGRFPQQKWDIPGAAVAHLAKQLRLPAELFLHYDWHGRTSPLKKCLRVARSFMGASHGGESWGRVMGASHGGEQTPDRCRMENTRVHASELSRRMSQAAQTGEAQR